MSKGRSTEFPRDATVRKVKAKYQALEDREKRRAIVRTNKESKPEMERYVQYCKWNGMRGIPVLISLQFSTYHIKDTANHTSFFVTS